MNLSTKAAVIALSLSLIAGFAQADVVWDESLDGDLSNSEAAPTAIILVSHADTIAGVVGGPMESSPPDDFFDAFLLDVPAGQTIDAVVLAENVPDGSNITSGFAVYLGANGSNWVGATFMEEAAIGTDLLAATGVGPIVGPAQYTISLREATPNQSYTLEVQRTYVELNEVRIDQSGADNDEYFELAGAPATALDGLTYLVIGDGSGASGMIEQVTDLTGLALDSNGFMVAAEATFSLGGASVTTTLNFENSDNVTHLLVRDFTGANFDDLDTDNDGTLDTTPWLEIVDCLALVETVGSGDQVYCATTLGPDGVFVPGHSYRCPAGWYIGDFTLGVNDTPNAANTCSEPGVSITKTVPPLATVPLGGAVTYTVTLGNLGPGDATTVTLTDTLPPEVDFASWVNQPAGATESSDVITWSGGVVVGETVTFTFATEYVGGLGDVVTNTAGFSHATASGQDSAAFTAESAYADLSISKTDGVSNAVAGQTVTYTIVAANNGPAAASVVTLTDTFPPVLTCTWTSTSSGGATGNGIGSGDLSQSLAMPVGSAVTYTVPCAIDAGTSGTITNSASVSSPIFDNDAANNTASDQTVVVIKVIRVDADANGVDDGTTWEHAYPNLQDALFEAVGGDQIWIAEGIYYPDVGAGQIGDSVSSTFSVPNGVEIYGGFDGTEDELSARDVDAHVTILSGDIDEDDVNDDGNQIAEDWNDLQGANAQHVVSANDTDNSTVLDGLTITAGRNGTSGGGGILCTGSGRAPILRNLTLSGHLVDSGERGGCVYNCANAVVNDSLFSGCRAVQGGAWSGGGTFTDVVFKGNYSGAGGGAIRGNELTLKRCALVGNSARTGSAIQFISGAFLLDTVLISGNQARNQSGGAVRIDGTGTGSVINSTVTGNFGGNGDDFGGGVYVNSSGVVDISNSIIWNNSDSTGTGTLSSALVNASATILTVTSSIVQGSGGSSGWIPGDIIDGAGNLDVDPLFVAPVDPATAPSSEGNFRVVLGSPAVNSGDGSQVTTMTDLDGEPRIQGGEVDMGAYEGAEPTADLGITKTDGLTTAIPGGPLTYTIAATNYGPSDDPSVSISDALPAGLACAWIASFDFGSTGNANGVGDLAETVSMPLGSTVDYTVSCLIPAGATGTLTNTASVVSSLPDLNPGNNSATDDDTVLVPSADVAVSKTDNVTSAAPGGSVSYDIVVSNSGPSDAPSVTLGDSFPPELTCAWTSTASGGASGNGSGNGDISQSLSMPAGSSVSYLADCSISQSATGTLLNTATASSTVPDPSPGNNSAVDNDTVLALEADLTITKDDGVSLALPGDTVTYTIVVGNDGPSDVVDAVVGDLFPAELTGCQSTCAAGAGASCMGGPANGDLSDLPDIPAGSQVTYTSVCTVDPAASFVELANTATVSAPAGTIDPDGTDNSATDTDLGPEVFADGFESGDSSVWSASVGAAKRLMIVPTDRDELLFSFAVALDRSGRSTLIALDEIGHPVLRLHLGVRPGELTVGMAARHDDGTWSGTSPTVLSGHGQLELEWRRATDRFSGDGELHLTSRGAPVAWLVGLDNDQQNVREVVAVGDAKVEVSQ